AARDLGQARRAQGLDLAAALEHTRKQAKVRAGEEIAHVLQLEAEAQVGLVGAIALHGVLEGDTWERSLLDALVAYGRHQVDHELLAQVEHVVAIDEAHLQVELRELRLAVAALVLVAETARDLEIALEAGHHEQLLE